MIGHDRLALVKVVECPACGSVNGMLWYEEHLTRCYFCRECPHHWEVSSVGMSSSDVQTVRQRGSHQRVEAVREAVRLAAVTPADRAEMMSVESYIDDLHGECEDQTERIAQLERQLDDLRATVRELMTTPS